MVTAEKITTETTKSVTSPSPSLCSTVLRMGFTDRISPWTPGNLPSRHASYGAAGPPARRRPGSHPTQPRLGEPPTLGNFQAVTFPIRADLSVSQLLRGCL